MNWFNNFHLDRLSFWLGFIAGGLFMLVAYQIRRVFPLVRQFIVAQIQENRRRAMAGVEAYHLQETLKHAQKMHLAQTMFSLDEVLVTPELLAPPAYLTAPTESAQSDSIVDQIFPFLPDWPELASQYGASRLTLAQALSAGSKIAVVGQPGSGKTVTLAHLASLIARRDASAGQLANHLPLLTHALDLFAVGSSEPAEPLQILTKLATQNASMMAARQYPRLLQGALAENRVLLIVDGLDELDAADLQSTVTIVAKISQAYPEMQMVVSAAPHDLDGLTALGFFPLPVAAWNPTRWQNYIARWGKLWRTYIQNTPETENLPPELINNWLTAEPSVLSPLEWTLRTWGAFAGDSAFVSSIQAIYAACRRLAPGVSLSLVEQLAFDMLRSGHACRTAAEMDNFLSKASPSDIPEFIPTDQPKPQKKAREISSGGKIISILLENGLLVEHAGCLSFVNPVIFGMLAAGAMPEEYPTTPDLPITWPAMQIALRYTAAGLTSASAWLEALLGQEDPVLQRPLFTVARWLCDAAPSAPWRSLVMKRLLNLLQEETRPVGLRARALAACVCANDSSMPILFRQLLLSNSILVRELGALGIGGVQDTRSLNELTKLLADPQPEVRQAACLAISTLQSQPAQDTLVDILKQGDETLRLAAAESLSWQPPLGHDLLKSALEMDDLLLRRAAVFGLARIRQPWAAELLEKVAVQDGQWVVRNAAGHALEEFQRPSQSIPRPLPVPHESAWLITYASKQGQGIAPGQPVNDMLLKAMNAPDEADQLAALELTRLYNDDSSVSALIRLTDRAADPVREAGLFTLWLLASSGKKIRAQGYSAF